MFLLQDNPEQQAGILIASDVLWLCFMCVLVGLKWLINAFVALPFD
jgi:hypothetical protein